MSSAVSALHIAVTKTRLCATVYVVACPRNVGDDDGWWKTLDRSGACFPHCDDDGLSESLYIDVRHWHANVVHVSFALLRLFN